MACIHSAALNLMVDARTVPSLLNKHMIVEDDLILSAFLSVTTM